MTRFTKSFAFGICIGALGCVSGTTLACTSVDTSKGMLDAMYVASKNETVSGDVDAHGCDIGVYVPEDVKNVTIVATVHDADQFGVFNNGNARLDGGEIYYIGHHSGEAFVPNGSQTGIAVYFFAATGSIENSDIHDYQKGGVVVNGLSRADVTGNDVTGANMVDNIAQNGIQFGYGARGTVMRNVVTSNWYVGANWSSTGILLFETGHVTVQDNAVQDNQVGIDAEAWCWFEPSADNNRIDNNEVIGADYGVSVAAISFGGYSQCDASADNNEVVNNVIDSSSTGGTTGISLGTGVFSGGTDTPSADNNKLIHNAVNGFVEDIDASGDSSSKVHANVIE